VVRLSIVSLNACGLPWVRPSFAARAEAFCRHVEELGADIVNLQEVHTPGRLALVRSLLPSMPYVAYRPGLLRQPRGDVVTFSRHPLEPAGYTSFAGTTRDPRAAAKGVLVSRLPDLTVVNAHLTANKSGDWTPAGRFYPMHQAQLRRLHEACRAVPGNAVLTGDFNIAADSDLHAEVTDGGGWVDAFADDGRATFQAAFLPPGAVTRRIDFVLLRGPVTVHETRLLFTEPAAMAGREAYVSDHVGLYVDATFG
jgi:endonuclease/exonuclease/phosphatase family metal-dependent hydrolase